MQALEYAHFLRPWLLLLCIPLGYVLYVLKTSQGSLGNWKKICDPALLAYLQVGSVVKASTAPLWWFGLAGLLAIAAIAGPAWQQLPQAVYREQSALIIMLDLSRSMDATDLKPNRLTRAKQKITDLLTLRHEGQTALLVFAGSAFVVTPLTEDTQTILAQLQGLSTDIMPVQGGNIDVAMAKALELLQQASVQHGQILLFTDSEAYSAAKVQQLTQAGHDLSVIGVGTSAGAPIAKASGGFLTDRQGNIVIPKLHEQALQGLAKQGHGVYRQLSLDNSDIAPVLARSPNSNWSEEQEKSMQTSDQWREEGPWLLLVIMPLVLLGFRRGVLVVALCFSLNPDPAQAFGWQELWQSPDQQAQAAMQAKDYAGAEKNFTDPAWKAAAAYKNKDYEASLQALDSIQQPSADDWYNKGNALAQLGRLDEAIAAYDEALKQDATLEDAQSNKELLQKIKNEQDKQKKEQQGKEGQQGEKSGGKSDTSEGDKQAQDQSAEQQDGHQKGDGESQPHQSEKGDQEMSQAQAKEQEAKDKAEQAAEQNKAQQDGEQEKAAQNKAQQDGEQEKAAQNKAKKQKISAEDIAKSEVKQAFEQSLRRIPDDPAGLLRRKFKYQYQQQHRGQKNTAVEQW